MSVGELTGTELEHYRLLEPLGEGGMGVVYRAEDLALRRKVAVKVLSPSLLDDLQARRRFQDEITHASAIEHPHIVPVYAAGYDKRHFFLVLRLIEGPDVMREIRRVGPLSENRTLRLLGQVASALWAVHDAGRVHRDVKPHNILIGSCGEIDEHAQLTDFGIAKALDATSGLTGMGAIGTAGYMAPEVLLGRGATARADQYSLAVTAYEMLAGVSPYEHEPDLRQAHVEAVPRPLDEVVPGLSPAVVHAVHRGLAKDPAERFADIRELAAADLRSRRSFDDATGVQDIVRRAANPEEAAALLTKDTGLSDAAIADMTDSSTQGVARLRRRAARAALVGGGTRRRRS